MKSCTLQLPALCEIVASGKICHDVKYLTLIRVRQLHARSIQGDLRGLLALGG
jgi:hypothetical protein